MCVLLASYLVLKFNLITPALPHRLRDTAPPLPLPLQALHLLDLLVQQTLPGLRVPRPGPTFTEHELDLLDALAGRLRVGEVSLDGGGEAQHAEDDECFPADVVEGGRDEEADGEVEEPVGGAGEGHARGAGLERPDLGGVDPGDGREGQGVDDHEEVAEGDDGVGGVARDADDDVEVVAHALRHVGAVVAQHAADDEHADAHADGAVDEQGPAAGVVDEEEGAGREDDEERVLHPGRDEPDVPCQPGHLEDVDYVVGHHVGS